MTETNLRKHTLMLGADQYERLAELHPDVPTAKIIRRIIDIYLRANEENLKARRTVNVDVKI